MQNTGIEKQIQDGDLKYIDHVIEYKIMDMCGLFTSSAYTRFSSNASTAESYIECIEDVVVEIQVNYINNINDSVLLFFCYCTKLLK